MKIFGYINIALSLLSAFLAYNFYCVVSAPDMEPPGSPGKTGAANTDRKSGGRMSPGESEPAIGEYYVIIEKSLFDPERGSAGDSGESEDEEMTPLELRNFVLVGCITLDNGVKAAFIKNKPKRTTERYYLGDDFEGYTVSEIQPFKVCFTKGKNTSYLALFDEGADRDSRWKPTSRSRSSTSNSKNRSTNRSHRRVTDRTH